MKFLFNIDVKLLTKVVAHCKQCYVKQRLKNIGLKMLLYIFSFYDKKTENIY